MSVSTNRAWLRALELTSSIALQPHRILPSVIEEVAERMGDAPALLSNRECLSYRQLQELSNQYARWAVAQGLQKGETVCLLMANSPCYLAVWLGMTSVGVVVGLINTNLVGASLAHSIRTISPRIILAGEECLSSLAPTIDCLDQPPVVSVIRQFGAEMPTGQLIHAGKLAVGELLEVTTYSGEPLTTPERRSTTIDDLALYIFTSGTTGLPKAARVTHARVMQWSHWFTGMMEVQPSDRMYNCLPMYHSVGGVQAPGAMLVAGASMVIRENFSASAFWSDLSHWECTLFQYIGEMCRYLLATSSSKLEAEHRIRLACGNGLAPEVWAAFQQRFNLPRILEFYASTEGNVSLFNVPAKSGAIGHIPLYLAHRFSPPLVVHDVQTGEPARNASGLCVRCGDDEAGEALGRIDGDPFSSIGSRFEGYSSVQATDDKILRDVFVPGDAWYRTGDLMRRDEKGFFYFVDRVGDTFRRKGENVATTEIAASMCAFDGIDHASVYGVAVPGVEGRVGMATLVASDKLDLVQLRVHLDGCLPAYARPLFLRLRSTLAVTGTWKYTKVELAREAYDPRATEDPLYVDLPGSRAFVRLDGELYERIQRGGIRF